MPGQFACKFGGRMVVCITGMHRSGTSMVARLLNLCGLYLGEETELIGAAEDNSNGFWENVNFVNLNDEIMLRFKGGWDTPPKFRHGWETSRKILPLKHKAEELLQKFNGHKDWGWKDPRNSITLPFWQQLIPNLKVIICLRNPLDVAHSLSRRGYASETFSFYLWQTYNRRLLDSIHPKNRIITHYDSYFYDAEAELRRLLRFIGIPIEEELLKTACTIASTSMRHSQSTVDALVSAKAPKEVTRLYLDMCSQAGGTYWGEIQPDLNHTDSFNSRGNAPESSTTGLLVRLAEKEKFLQTQQTLIQENQATIQEQKSILQQKESELQQRENEIRRKDVELKDFNTLLSKAENELQTLKSGTTYLAISKYRSNIERFFPHGTRRRRMYELLPRSIAILLTEGPRGLYSRIRNRWGSASSARTKYFGLKLPIKKSNPPLRESTGSTEYTQAYSEMLTVAAGEAKSEYVPLSEIAFDEESKVKLIAFYLPQFHPISENDAWWGRGFTEWTNVSKAVPQFVGHYQPHLPGELGFYDLRVPDVQRRQVELAKHYGIYGFCFYYYWFNGKRLLERPLEQFITDPEINFPFCLCWANENWTRRWDGLENEILIAQEHSSINDLKFIQDIAPILKHKNYIRINNRPLLIVYRTQQLPDPASTAERWRKYCIETGIGDPFLVAAQVFGFFDPGPIGFDAAVEFPPNNMGIQDINRNMSFVNPAYSGKVYRYTDVQAKLTDSNHKPPYKLFKTVFPGWDNEARRPGRGFTFVLSSPNTYKNWLVKASKITIQNSDPAERLVFINAWNEWAEGAHLEPDRKYGYAYLQATADALHSLQELSQSDQPAFPLYSPTKVVKRHETAVVFHLFYTDMWDEFDSYLTNLNDDFDLFVSIPEGVEFRSELILNKYPQAYIYRPKNQGRDIAPFINIFTEIYPLQYKYICKMHTKRSTHRQDGHIWRQDLMQKLLGSEIQVEMAKHVLDENPDVGIIAPEGHVVPGSFYWGKNETKVHMLAQRIGIPWNKQNFQFVAGSMFWLKPSAICPITSLELSQRDFEDEQGQVDGTLAHALERFLGLLTQSSGFRIIEIGLNGNIKDTTLSAIPDYRFVKA
jgi:lipopolysaccharide biosynthesis protein